MVKARREMRCMVVRRDFLEVVAGEGALTHMKDTLQVWFSRCS